MTTSYSPPSPAEIPPALLPTAETTAEKRIRRYNEALTTRGKAVRRARRELPGLDVAAAPEMANAV